MELTLQFAYKISKKILEPAYHWYEFGGFRFTFKRFLKFQVTSEELIASLSKINTLFSEQASGENTHQLRVFS